MKNKILKNYTQACKTSHLMTNAQPFSPKPIHAVTAPVSLAS